MTTWTWEKSRSWLTGGSGLCLGSLWLVAVAPVGLLELKCKIGQQLADSIICWTMVLIWPISTESSLWLGVEVLTTWGLGELTT